MRVPVKAPVIGHLGPRVSALLDGQLSPADEERAWEHVHSCHHCRDQVEREGWVKTRLASMSLRPAAEPGAPAHLKGSLLMGGWADAGSLPYDGLPEHAYAGPGADRSRRGAMTAISGGAVGAAVLSVMALGASPANAPGALERPTSARWTGALTATAARSQVPSAVGQAPAVRESRLSDVSPWLDLVRRTLTP